jgi:hypothetical protein
VAYVVVVAWPTLQKKKKRNTVTKPSTSRRRRRIEVAPRATPRATARPIRSIQH